MKLSPTKIAKILKAPKCNVEKFWPLILDELKRRGKNKLYFQVAIIATVGVESGYGNDVFAPIHEYGSKARFKRLYDIKGSRPHVARRLGNVNPGDGVKYAGRGFVQITGRHNYRVYGKAIDVDLENNPDLALDPVIAAKILVEYMVSHGIDVWANRAFRTDDDYPEDFCTKKIRKLVNGGLTHYPKFKRYWDKLKAEALA